MLDGLRLHLRSARARANDSAAGAGVDLVTASPYHAHGLVRNVPRWRLGLSKSLSHLYRSRAPPEARDLHELLPRLPTLGRTRAVRVEHKGFLGVAEMLGWLDLHGSRIVEFPTTLEVRMIGRSKMKMFRTIIGHLALLTRLAVLRVTMPRVALSPVTTRESTCSELAGERATGHRRRADGAVTSALSVAACSASGLALRLVEQGHRVTVLEAAPAVGGLGERRRDRRRHVGPLLPRDAALGPLPARAAARTSDSPTSCTGERPAPGFFVDGRLVPMSSASTS